MNKTLSRINHLFDKNSFKQMDDLAPSIHVLGRGAINGRPAYCCAGIAEARGVDLLECFRRKIRWLETIIKKPAPVIWMHDYPPSAPGGRTPIPPNSAELLASNSNGVGRAFCIQARLNNVTPQFAALFSDVGAVQTFGLRLADFTVLERGTHVWIGRPDAVKLMTGQNPDPEQLGGAEMHCKISGVGDVLVENDAEALDWISRCVSILPLKKGDSLPVGPDHPPELPSENISGLIPDDLNKPFDMRPVLLSLIDAGSWVGLKELYAKEIIAGFARIAGVPTGIIANNSSERGGIIFPESCRKMTWLIRFCDNYNIPILFLADNPGLMVGVQTEQAGMLTEASDLLRALADAKTNRACLVVRKAYTAGLYAMSGPGFDPAHFWATEKASISVFGPKALDYFGNDRELPKAISDAIREMKDNALNPMNFEKKGLLSGVIPWNKLRSTLEKFAINPG